MKINVILFLVCVAITTPLFAQDAAKAPVLGWKTDGTVGANFTQVSLSNWSGGGQNTVGITGLFSYQANMQGEASVWKNSFDLGYGLTKLGDQEFRKSDDRLFVKSQYDYKASEVLAYTALMDFRTQFTVGYKYNKNAAATGDTAVTISNFMAPANLLVGLGATYTPVEYFKVTVAPLGNVLMVVSDENLRANYGYKGDEVNSAVKSLLCASLDAQFKKEILTNVTLASGLNVIAPYSEFAQQIVNWNTLLTLKVNDYINASLAVDVVYNERVLIKDRDGIVGNNGPGTQVRNVLGIGLGYKF